MNTDPLLTALRETAASTGWHDATLVVDTTAEKLAKAGTIGPRQWPALQALITQSEGGLSVAPASDKRPAASVTAKAEDFADLT